MSQSRFPAPEAALAPRLATRALGGFGTSILGGASLGSLAWLSDLLDYPLGLLLPLNGIGAWLAVAFALGASARTVPTGALRGLIGLISAVAAYYLLFATLGDGFRAIGAGHAATIWGVVALLAGPALGAAGASWRHRAGWHRIVAVALLASAVVAEGIVFGGEGLVRFDSLPSDPGAWLLGAEIVLGATLPWALLPAGERLRGYLAMLGLAVAAVAAIGPVIGLIRGLADRF